MNQPLYEQHFEAQDARFVEALRAADDMSRLAAFVSRWTQDGRAWAYEQMFRYLDQPWDCPGHQPVIKRLFKWAEAEENDELMAAFAVGCDRLVRRQRQKRWEYDWRTRDSWEVTVLVSPSNTIPLGAKSRAYRNPRTGEYLENVPLPVPEQGKLFSYHTRYYLRRRAWRYFRRTRFQKPDAYPLSLAKFLILYRDEDLEKGENLLDSWSLMHACFHNAEALEFGSSLIRIRPGHTLGELKPAPYALELWQKPASFDVLMLIVQEARSRAMRVWAIDMLKEYHFGSVRGLKPEELRELLTSGHPEVQQFVAELLENAEGLDEWPISVWLQLLEIENLTAVEAICRVMAKNISAEDLTWQDCLHLATAEPVPVARLGLNYLQQKPVSTEEERAWISQLSEAECDALGQELAAWALPILGTESVYNRDHVLPFFDSLSRSIRSAAWIWLKNEADPTNAAAFDDPIFWCRLLETPFDDVRAELINLLELRSARRLPRPEPELLAPVWCSVLLGVHRGGREKLKSVRQLAAAIANNPARADRLLPVLSIAVRSIREPEMRESLSALAGLMNADPDLAGLISKNLPEIHLTPLGETVW